MHLHTFIVEREYHPALGHRVAADPNKYRHAPNGGICAKPRDTQMQCNPVSKKEKGSKLICITQVLNLAGCMLLHLACGHFVQISSSVSSSLIQLMLFLLISRLLYYTCHLYFTHIRMHFDLLSLIFFPGVVLPLVCNDWGPSLEYSKSMPILKLFWQERVGLSIFRDFS